MTGLNLTISYNDVDATMMYDKIIKLYCWDRDKMMGVEGIKKHLFEQFNLPMEQIETMMPSFISTLSSHMEALEGAFSENDLIQLGKAGHTIKGAFLNLGLKECAKVALEIEESGKAGNEQIDYRAKIDSLHCFLESVFK